jgi:hypothetical protein
MLRKTFGALPLIAVAALGLFAVAPASAATLCPSDATVGGFGNTSTNVPGPLDGSCGPNSAVKIDIPASNDYGKLQFNSGMAGWPTGLTLGGLSDGSASANVAFTGANDPYFLLAFFDGTNSLGQGAASDQILMLNFQPSTLSGNTMPLDPSLSLFNLYDNTTGVYLQAGQADTHTLDVWLALFPLIGNDQLQGIWIGEGLTAGDSGPESLTVNSLTVTPIPAALPLFASGAGVLGYFGWRRKKKALATA